MKIEIDVQDIEILESHSGKGDHREWGRMSWIYPGEIVCQISPESSKKIQDAWKIILDKL